MKIKVLFFASTLERGGPTNVIYNIVKYLDRDVIEPCILTLSPEPRQSKKQEFEGLSVQIYSFHRGRIWWIFSRMRALKELIDEIGPDIIHSHSLRPDVTSAKHLSSYIRMATIHGNLADNYGDTYGKLIGNYFANKQLRSLRRLDHNVACSQSVFDDYNDDLSTLSCIQNGVDEQLFHPLPHSDIVKSREQLNLPVDKKIIVTVGSLIARKDPATVIKAFIQSKSHSNTVLVILGTGPLEKLLRKEFTDRNIRFIGFADNVSDYLKCSDLFISASTSEGLPNSVIEALACGVPVCLSDIDPHGEILKINNKAGTLFSCHDHNKLANDIDNILYNNSTNASSAALSIVKEKLNARVMALSYQKLYVSLHHKHRSKNV